MGLVVQAPMDALLPAAEAAPTGAAGQPGLPEGSGDVFAGLLASLSATLEGETMELTGDDLVLPVGDESTGEGKKKTESDALAALFAMSMPVTPVVIPTEFEVAAEESSAVSTIAATAEASSEELDVAAEGADAASNELLPTSAEAAEPALPVVGEQPSGEGTNDTNAEAVASSARDLSGVASPETAVATSAPAAVAPAREESARGPGAPPSEADAPQADGTEATSVVRTVGNAETGTEAGEGETGQGKERRANVERPQPKASAQGIANAAANSAVGEMRQTQDSAPVDAAAAPADTAPPAELPQQVEQVATTVIEQVDAGGGEARIHLDPVDLGEVTIHVRTEGDSVRVEIHTERREAMNLLRDHSQDLSTLLGQRGLNLSDVNVGLGRGNGGQAWGDDQTPQNRPVSGEFAAMLGIDDGASMERHQRLRAAYNPDGAHFYRV